MCCWQGMSVAAIAALKRIQPSSVQGYLAEAVLYGHAYRWHSFGVSDAVLAAVEIAAAAVLCNGSVIADAEAAAAQPPAGSQSVPVTSVSTAAAMREVAPAAAAAQYAPTAPSDLMASSSAQWATGVFADQDNCSHSDTAAAACMQAAAGAVQSVPTAAGRAHDISSHTAHVAQQRTSMVAAPSTHARVALQASAGLQAAGGFLQNDLAARLAAAGVTQRAFRHVCSRSKHSSGSQVPLQLDRTYPNLRLAIPEVPFDQVS